MRRSSKSLLGSKVSHSALPYRLDDYRILYMRHISEEREAKAKLKKLKEEEAKKAEEEVTNYSSPIHFF